MRLIKSILTVCFVSCMLYIALYAADTWRTGRQNAQLAASVETARQAEHAASSTQIRPDTVDGEAKPTAVFGAPPISALPEDTPGTPALPVSEHTGAPGNDAVPEESAAPGRNAVPTERAVPQTTPLRSEADASAPPVPPQVSPGTARPGASPEPTAVPTAEPEQTAVPGEAAILPEQTMEPDEATILPEYAALAAQNPEMIGWLRIDGMRIDYPVMHTPQEPEFYLHRGFDRAYAFEGVPFLDARCDAALPTDNLIIYGHNMRNGSMFGTLKAYLKEEFYQEHPLIRFDTLTRRGVYRVFAVIPVVLGEMEDERMRCYGVSLTQDEEQLALLAEYVRRYAVLSTPQALPEVGGEVLTLSTCTGFRGANRLVVMAARTQLPGDD